MTGEGRSNQKEFLSRASMAIARSVCTVMLVDINERPLMNLHKVPHYVLVSDVKSKISERLKEVGRNLPADLMILKCGDGWKKEMEDDELLSHYNTMELSQIKVQIFKRQKLDITIVVIKPEGKCLCINTSKGASYDFPVCVPSGSYVKQLRTEIARRMNCNVDRRELELFSDPELQQPIVIEGTCRAKGICQNDLIYTKCPRGFDIDNLAPLEAPPVQGAEDKKPRAGTETEPANEAKQPAEDILTASTEAEEEKTEQKTAVQIDFEKKAGKGGTMDSMAAAEFARKLGYSPSAKDIQALPKSMDYKAFQNFLTGALHAEDIVESFQNFFSLFDTQATGDLSAKQLRNIMQMYGDEPLSKAEAEQFTKLIMGNDTSMPIKVIAERILDGQL